MGEEQRRVLRTALKGEYIRKKYDPKAYSAEGGLIFDAAVQRWHALQFTYGDHFKPTFTNFMKYSCCGIIPVFLYYQFCWGPHHKEYNRAVRRGEVAYDADSRRMKYFNQRGRLQSEKKTYIVVLGIKSVSHNLQ